MRLKIHRKAPARVFEMVFVKGEIFNENEDSFKFLKGKMYLHSSGDGIYVHSTSGLTAPYASCLCRKVYKLGSVW